ncbi:hypothetical protein EDD16DRAFT_1502663 [Pisolithus croceorrhizus]|nr:hypothetical protein EDD16DRAFT_1502663 [Pisolithus croceorrhizus]KAI6117755.1 hypothetical protein EV401DRAFT_1863185 [Pisolithus croceorrhizus]KAI6159746.1 hypothetical protein EDD17DRAFT_1486121 [Pisolithus thermaeus]
MTPAYAFMDYRSRGQTTPCVIVIIITPSSGSLNLFNSYVALSRSGGSSSTCLLRDSNDKLLPKSHCKDIRKTHNLLSSCYSVT